MDLKARIDEDLAFSGLVPGDLGIRELDNSIRAATKVGFGDAGYVIPYFTLQGKSAPFYRVKLFDHDPKYKQPKDTPSYVYFPKGFMDVAAKSPYVIITEGEKKAARAVKAGFPCVALGGVYSWRNRLLILPAEAEISAGDDKAVQAKLPSGVGAEENFMSPLAIGLQDLMDYCMIEGKTIIILFDQDAKSETAFKVQAAAAEFAYELRFRGLEYAKIRQIRLPVTAGSEKAGLDDFLEERGEDALQKLITGCMGKAVAFPRHPNIRDFLNKRLQRGKMSRKELQQISTAVLCELDANGLRLRSEQEAQTYYFDRITHKLHKVNFNLGQNELAELPFGHFLYRTYGIGSADSRLIQWVGTQFTGEDPISSVEPHRVLAKTPLRQDAVLLQLGDGAFAEVSGIIEPGSSTPGLRILDNGEENILFESGHVEPLDIDRLKTEYAKRMAEPLNPWWADVLTEVRLVDKHKQRILTALLFYIAPWLQRWRGTQLPLEMTLGEAGSGKSTLQELRMDILSGKPQLRNAPQDMRDWTASVSNTGGLHILDNVQLMDKNLRQRLSDEYCRLITEPNPKVEMRKLYTDNTLIQVPTRCQFGITAIKQPFLNADILARSIIIELDKSLELVNGTLAYDASWKANQITRFGGREAWVSHHLYALHKFFLLAQKEWNFKYQAKHRLINLEQCLVLMGKCFGIDGSWIPDYLSGSIMKATVSADWALEGIITFGQEYRSGSTFTAQDISNWAMANEEYMDCEELTNSRRLGRYMQTHKTIIASEGNIIEAGKQNNRIKYQLRREAPKRP